MRKQAILILIGIAGVALVAFLLKSDNIAPDENALAKYLIESRVIERDDVSREMPPHVIAQAEVSNDKKIYFLAIPSRSGTAGETAFIILEDNGTLKNVGHFFGLSDILNETLKIKGDVIHFTEASSVGACCLVARDVEINLVNPDRSVMPDFKEPLSIYIDRHNISGADELTLSESIGNYKWLSDTTILMERSVYTMDGTQYPKETWEYDIISRSFKLAGNTSNQ